MHPILDKEKFSACEDLIEALEECHNRGFLSKMLGRCSPLKQELSDCLHQTRMAEQRKKIIERKKKNQEFELKKKQLYEEEYGKDGYLKKVFEKPAEGKEEHA